MDALDLARRDRPAGDRLELARHVRATQRGELDPPHDGLAAELGDEPPQRVAGVELAGPIRQEDGDPLRPQVAGEELDQIARRAVGPVDVLEHDRERLALVRDACELLQQSLAQPSLTVAARGDGLGGAAREQADELAGGSSSGNSRSAAVTGAYGNASPPNSMHSP